MVQASFIRTSFQNLFWLGGSGYDRVGLYIHGTQYNSPNGEVVPRTFVPILFENLADAIVSRCDEFGAPVLGCDIETVDDGSSNTVELRWRGTAFGRFCWAQLHRNEISDENGSDALYREAPAKHNPDLGLLTYRYVPAVGKLGMADAEYAVLEPYDKSPLPEGNEDHQAEDDSNRVVQLLDDPKKRHVYQGSFSFTTGDVQCLPTIHHIVKVLQDIPIYDVLEAKVETVPGDDFSHACRID